MSGHNGLDVVVVNWNGRRFLSRCLDSLQRSSLAPRIIVVDNASDDGSVDHVRNRHPDVEVLPLGRNLGYAAGANRGLSACAAPLAMILNPDVVVAPDHLAILVERMKADPSIGAAQGKLYRVSADDFDAGSLRNDVLDSAGHVIRRTRMVLDRGQGESDDARWKNEASVFSASGAALILRRSMLYDLAPDGSPFDPTFFAYKEDIDLCWRARLFGWDVRYVPNAVAHHVRALPGLGRRGRGAPAFARRHSWMNHWLMILKNDSVADLVRYAPWILGWEILRFGHALVRDPALLPAYIGIWKRVPDALRARRFIQSSRRATGNDMRRWFGADAVAPSTPPLATSPASPDRAASW